MKKESEGKADIVVGRVERWKRVRGSESRKSERHGLYIANFAGWLRVEFIFFTRLHFFSFWLGGVFGLLNRETRPVLASIFVYFCGEKVE